MEKVVKVRCLDGNDREVAIPSNRGTPSNRIGANQGTLTAQSGGVPFFVPQTFLLPIDS
ncbi:MAG: hypothetical protein V1897_00045 [Pseudomonadota bacterium]